MTGNRKFMNHKWYKRRKKNSSQTNKTIVKAENTKNDPTQHGYYGFKLYFINDDSIDVQKTLANISTFEKYIQRNDKQFSLSDIQNNKVFFVDLNLLESDDEFKSSWSEFKTEIVTNTEHCLACMGLAMHQTLSLEEKLEIKESDSKDVLPRPYIPLINARITNHQPILSLKNLKVNYFSTLVSVRGTVIKASNVRLLCKYMTFICSSCSGTQVVNQPDGLYSTPTQCPTKGCRAQSNFIPSFSSQTCTINWQTLKLQELVGIDQGENGRIPRTVECELTDDLVGCCIPGDDVTITGVIKVRNTSEIRNKKNQPSVFLLYIDAISVVNNKNHGQAMSGAADRITFNTNDYYAIQKIHAEPLLFRFLVHSLCPNIYGKELVKAGLLLTLFGGTNSTQGDDIATRAISHVLMVGDPGLGKSHILQACTNVAPRGVYVCGNTSTSSGLTVTMTKESNGDYSLEAGALILADQGCCCIDEFDKMTNQHASLLEAMEQQSISIAKAGVTCNLAACTSILAAANPAGGHYNKAKTVSENIKMSSPLISRFDVVFILLDQSCEQQDRLLSDHVLALHSGLRNKSFPIPTSSSTNDKILLKDRLKLEPGENVDYLPHQLFRKYIAYAQKYVHPSVSQEAQDILRQFYLKLREQCQINSCSPVTARQLESLLRLTQARAKVELREEATAADAVDVIEIMRHSFIDIFTDELGTLDFRRSQNGSGLSKQNEVKKLLMLLQEKAESLTQSVFSQEEIRAMAEQLGISKDRFFAILQTLNIHGYLLKKPLNKYQLTSVDFV